MYFAGAFRCGLGLLVLADTRCRCSPIHCSYDVTLSFGRDSLILLDVLDLRRFGLLGCHWIGGMLTARY